MRIQLSKEDEAAVGKDEQEVRREDQDKINKFSRLHQREMALEEELKLKAVCHQLAFISRKDLTNFAERQRGSGGSLKRIGTGRQRRERPVMAFIQVCCRSLIHSRFKIGDTFISLPLAEVQEKLTSSTEEIDESVSATEGKLSTIREEMEQLKVQLYARFGKSINLET